MRAFAVSLALVVFAFSSADVYHVQHRRPSSLLANLLVGSSRSARIFEIKGGATPLVPEGVNLKADDQASTVTIDGPKDLVADMSKLLDEFDVAARKVSAHIVVHSKADKYDSATDTQISNNSIFAIQDETTHLSLQISPRINGDGTVTGTFAITTPSGSVRVVSRAAANHPIRFNHDDVSTSAIAVKAKKEHTLLDVLDGLDIEVTFSMEDDAKLALKK